MATVGTKTPLLTIADAGERLNVSEKTVRRLVGRGDLPSVRVGRLVRVDANDLEHWLVDHRVGSGRGA